MIIWVELMLLLVLRAWTRLSTLIIGVGAPELHGVITPFEAGAGPKL